MHAVTTSSLGFVNVCVCVCVGGGGGGEANSSYTMSKSRSLCRELLSSDHKRRKKLHGQDVPHTLSPIVAAIATSYLEHWVHDFVCMISSQHML